MLLPPRCSCNRPIGTSAAARRWIQEIQKRPGEANLILDEMNMTRLCCRAQFIAMDTTSDTALVFDRANAIRSRHDTVHERVKTYRTAEVVRRCDRANNYNVTSDPNRPVSPTQTWNNKLLYGRDTHNSHKDDTHNNNNNNNNYYGTSSSTSSGSSRDTKNQKRLSGTGGERRSPKIVPSWLPSSSYTYDASPVSVSSSSFVPQSSFPPSTTNVITSSNTDISALLQTAWSASIAHGARPPPALEQSYASSQLDSGISVASTLHETTNSLPSVLPKVVEDEIITKVGGMDNLFDILRKVQPVATGWDNVNSPSTPTTEVPHPVEQSKGYGWLDGADVNSTNLMDQPVENKTAHRRDDADTSSAFSSLRKLHRDRRRPQKNRHEEAVESRKRSRVLEYDPYNPGMH